MQTKLAKTKSSPVYIVDYDIPIKPLRKRRAFYRRLARLKQQMGLFGKMSTMSVLVTADRALALQVYDLAKRYGRANFYFGFRRCDGEENYTAWSYV